MRKTLNIGWPDEIRNKDLCEKCVVQEWSKIKNIEMVWKSTKTTK